jgi:cell division protein ZapE
MSDSPKQQYQHDLRDPHFHEDPCQAAAIEALDSIYQQLSQQARLANSWQKIFYRRKLIKGLYLWGGVGTGKSYLMNTFFNCLPFSQKIRLHFHEFMRAVHHDLTAFQGHKNPLELIAKNWAKKTLVLCFDEFFVKDIADAMLLGKLLAALFTEGVCLVATSNRKPEDLYLRGLQRERFLPAIKILQENVTVLQVDNNIDYRLEKIKPADVYFSPLDSGTEKLMMQSFHFYADNDVTLGKELLINKRAVSTIRASAQVVWFAFSALCETALGSDDYLQIAERYSVILLSDVPVFKGNVYNAAVRFINLIDVLYDKHSLLIMSAAVPIQQLYQDKEWAFEFERTKSRLLEMTSHEYVENYRASTSNHN